MVIKTFTYAWINAIVTTGTCNVISDEQRALSNATSRHNVIYIKGLGKAKCLKKMAQKRVVLSLTIPLHR